MTKYSQKITLILTLIVVLIYLFFQFVILNEKAKIELNVFPELTSKNSLILSGKALDLKNFFIQEREIFLNLDSEFSEEIFLFEGINKINLKGIKKNNKVIEKNIEIFKSR